MARSMAGLFRSVMIPLIVRADLFTWQERFLISRLLLTREMAPSTRVILTGPSVPFRPRSAMFRRGDENATLIFGSFHPSRVPLPLTRDVPIRAESWDVCRAGPVKVM